jgi:hypothetical protein
MIIYMPVFLLMRDKGKGKGRICPRTGHEGTVGEWRHSCTRVLISALNRGAWSAPHPGLFTPRKDPIHIVQEAEWAPGSVWTDGENLAPTGIRSQDRPSRSEIRLVQFGQISEDNVARTACFHIYLFIYVRKNSNYPD